MSILLEFDYCMVSAVCELQKFFDTLKFLIVSLLGHVQCILLTRPQEQELRNQM